MSYIKPTEGREIAGCGCIITMTQTCTCNNVTSPVAEVERCGGLVDVVCCGVCWVGGKVSTVGVWVGGHESVGPFRGR